MNKREYVEYHTLEYDILHSNCRECYLNNLECGYYQNKCRRIKEDE